jgi:hypothetical protein
MIERYRPATIPKLTERRSITPAPLFVCLPKPILQHPPVQHRNVPATGLLPVFDCAVAVAIVALARGQVSQQRHDFSFGNGKQAIRQQRKKLDKGSKWLNQYQVGGVNYEFHLAGVAAIWKVRKLSTVVLVVPP